MADGFDALQIDVELVVHPCQLLGARELIGLQEVLFLEHRVPDQTALMKGMDEGDIHSLMRGEDLDGYELCGGHAGSVWTP